MQYSSVPVSSSNNNTKFMIIGITMVDEEGNYYSYSNCRRRNETYSKRSNQIVLAEKSKNDNEIIKTETKLSKFNKRTLSSKKFIDYLQEKQIHTKNYKNFMRNHYLESWF